MRQVVQQVLLELVDCCAYTELQSKLLANHVEHGIAVDATSSFPSGLKSWSICASVTVGMRESARDQLSSAAAQQLLTLVWRTLGGGLRWIPEEVIVDQPGRLPSEFAALPIAPAAPVAADCAAPTAP